MKKYALRFLSYASLAAIFIAGAYNGTLEGRVWNEIRGHSHRETPVPELGYAYLVQNHGKIYTTESLGSMVESYGHISIAWATAFFIVFFLIVRAQKRAID